MADVLLVDNYDSFTWNLQQAFAALGAHVRVVRNDAADVATLLATRPTHLVLSPGPKAPRDAGVCLDLLRAAPAELPLLGVCLGHQALNEAFGGITVRASAPVHGKTSRVHHDGRGLFRGLPSPLEACRYHSLVAAPDRIPAELEACAWTDDGVVMALRHRDRPWHGLQFHPESFRTPEGPRLLAAFLT